MTRTTADIVPFRPRPPKPVAPPSELALVSRLLELAREADRVGQTRVAALLVGAAYGVAEDEPPPDGGGHRRVA